MQVMQSPKVAVKAPQFTAGYAILDFGSPAGLEELAFYACHIARRRGLPPCPRTTEEV